MCAGKDVFISVEECQDESFGVGGLAGWEVLSEGVLGEGEELVVALAVSLCSSFLLFRLFGWFILLSEECHVVQCVGSDGRVEDVQWGTVFCMKRWLESFG